MKILVAVDGSICSYAMTSDVARRPWPAGSRVKIITVVEPRPSVIPRVRVLPDNDPHLEQAGRSTIDKAIAHFDAGRPLEIESAVIHGHPPEAILREAEEWGADLIVLGSHGHRGIERFLLGSVSQKVAAHAKCSVEIVRCRFAQAS
ncbi:MAG TPA: universal stress protein [Blastocatellia bacterium]|nr:universal stress protein [Blastocatellia bacterium]